MPCPLLALHKTAKNDQPIHTLKMATAVFSKMFDSSKIQHSLNAKTEVLHNEALSQAHEQS
jgi:hypothetical protein